MIEQRLRGYINEAFGEFGIPEVPIVLEHPADMSHGDFATNVAMVGYAKHKEHNADSTLQKNQTPTNSGLNIGTWRNPQELAFLVAQYILRKNDPDIASVETAGPGFINFKLSKGYFLGQLAATLAQGNDVGGNDSLIGKKVIVEYTDPNPFKEFHIGHLMTNTIGESLSRIIAMSGAEVKRACYQGDVGLQIACSVWGMGREDLPNEHASLLEKIQYLGRAYARGASASKFDEATMHEIVVINKKIYERSDEAVNRLYDMGRTWSLEFFETIYQRLGTKFDYYFFESKTADFGKKLVLEHPEIFEQSDGAIIYKGDETMGLHTRVFINKEGLPTYEAKELGLAKIKYDTYPYDISLVVTGNEVHDYFKVLLDAMAKVFTGLAERTEHIGHGMMRLPSGKMSSRTGDVVTAESLINDTKGGAMGKIKEGLFTPEEKEKIAEQVAIGAIKYSILRQASGKDIIFNAEQALSFEGDSGPYLQYTHARTCSLLVKAAGKIPDVTTMHGEDVRPLHKYLLRFSEVVKRAEAEREPHYIATYLIELAREFNAFYGNTIVLDSASDEPYKLALVALVSCTLRKGLGLLGIPAPDKM